LPGSDDGGQLQLELGHIPSHDEADFLVGEGNRLAYLHLLSFPNWPGPLTLLVGPPKSGKSHLARIWAGLAHAVVPGPDQVDGLASAGGTMPVLIEDVDQPGYDENALFHLANQSMRDGRALLMTARVGVASWPYATEDFRSRARLATLLLVTPAEDIEVAQVLVKLFGDRQISVEPRVISYVASRMERSPEEAVALAELMDRLALSRGTAITRGVAAEALRLRRAAHGETTPIDGEEADDE
jgi:chromosomal replication initiation ATPase DnaA